MKRVSIHEFRTPIGVIRTAATEKGLALIALPGEPTARFNNQVKALVGDGKTARAGKINHQAERQIKAYLSGRRKTFSLPLDLRGTPFQVKVLRRVATIPRGRTRTYGQVARSVGRPGAARAVGSANARNPLPLVVPCHRVVATGGLGGYGGGLPLKRKLLKLEGAA